MANLGVMDLAGHRYGKLSVLGPMEKRGPRRFYWFCKCDCGRELWTRSDALRDGRSKSCGCMMGWHIDLSGKRFGKLTVISKMRPGQYLCRCDCGVEKRIASKHLQSGNTTSCSCIKTSQYGSWARGALFYGYGQAAEKRGLSFELDFHTFIDLVVKPCVYCGAELTSLKKHPNKKSHFSYTGLDRLDNSKGYLKTNVVPCCGTCNRLKSDLPYDDFKQRVIQMYNYWASRA